MRIMIPILKALRAMRRATVYRRLLNVSHDFSSARLLSLQLASTR
jgi:hypothetical protein